MFHIERDGHNSNYTCVHNGYVTDKRLSLAARGFFTAVLSLPDDWDFSVGGMATLLGVHKESVLRYIRELEELGYVRVESRVEKGRFSPKEYTFYENSAGENIAAENTATENTATEITVTENTAAENTATENTVTENTAAENTATEITATEKPSQLNTNIPNTKKQNTISTNRGGGQQEHSAIERQINADALRSEYGGEYIDRAIEVIADCMRAKSRTISGESIDNAELMRVFGRVSEEDIRRAMAAIKGKRLDSFSGYFGSVLFNGIKSRIERPLPPPQSDAFSSLDVEAIDEAIMAKYRRVPLST